MKKSEKNFFSTTGRINGSTFAPRSLAIVMLFAGIIVHLALTDFSSFLYINFALFGIAQALVAIQAVKRLHDIGKSGNSALICLLPVIGLIYAFVIALEVGEQRANKYGDVPWPNRIYMDSLNKSSRKAPFIKQIQND